MELRVRDLGSWAALCRLISAVHALLFMSVSAHAPPLYLPLPDTIAANVTLDGVVASVDREAFYSPHGVRAFWVVAPDFSQEGPWSTAVFVADVGHGGRAVRISIENHANATPVVQWVNDELLHVQVWWGRIAASDLVFDVVDGVLLYSRLVYHPPDAQTPSAALDIPPFRLSVEHIAGALPPAWQAVQVVSSPDVRQVAVITLPPLSTECYLEPTDEELAAVHAWLEQFVSELDEDSPPLPLDTVCRNCPEFRLSWQRGSGEGHFEFSEARPYRYSALDVLFTLLERLLERLKEEGECAA
jgi:hypothetical protein